MSKHLERLNNIYWSFSKKYYNTVEEFKKDIEGGLSEAGWKRNGTGWWWEESDGSYPTNSWKQINNEWFYFDDRGYCLINRWFNDGKD